MAQVYTNIQINGAAHVLPTNSSTLNIYQSYNTHHRFELSSLLTNLESPDLDGIRNMLGEYIDIEVGLKSDPSKYMKFRGIIDEVSPFLLSAGQLLKISGFAPTVLMDCGYSFRTYCEQPLHNIVEQVGTRYCDRNFPELQMNKLIETVGFAVQFETDYQFLCRLSEAHGKLFYYDGQQLRFGNFEDSPKELISLELGKDLHDLELSLNLSQTNFGLSGYHTASDSIKKFQDNKGHASLNRLLNCAIEKSSIYKGPNFHLNYSIENEQELEGLSRRLSAAQAHELVSIRGSSSNPEIQIGSTIYIDGGEAWMDKQFTIIKVDASVSIDNKFQNSFVAIPSDHSYPISMQLKPPTNSGPLIALIEDNRDPDQLGRVRLRFIGDENENCSHWIKTLTPYTGHGGAHLPFAIGDKVVVFYEGASAENGPFVLGAFYNGQTLASEWSDPDDIGFVTEDAGIKINRKTGELTLIGSKITMKAENDMELAGNNVIVETSRMDVKSCA